MSAEVEHAAEGSFGGSCEDLGETEPVVRHSKYCRGLKPGRMHYGWVDTLQTFL